MQFELKVNLHTGSGRYTLSEKTEQQSLPVDCKGKLFGNTDAASFYKAVAQHIADLSESGHVVKYMDVRK